MKVTARGFEPLFKSSRNMNIPHLDYAKSDAFEGDPNTPSIPVASGDPDLAAIAVAWSALPIALRTGIVAMVRTAPKDPTP